MTNLRDLLAAENVARIFHDTYERLAPEFGYTTRLETRRFDPSSPNGKLMIAVSVEVAKSIAPQLAAALIKAEDALTSIAANTCCDGCQEAALVARAALSEISALTGGNDG